VFVQYIVVRRVDGQVDQLAAVRLHVEQLFTVSTLCIEVILVTLRPHHPPDKREFRFGDRELSPVARGLPTNQRPEAVPAQVCRETWTLLDWRLFDVSPRGILAATVFTDVVRVVVGEGKEEGSVALPVNERYGLID